ncbi:nitroreductase family protein [Magnetovibrio sp.]|uniref:nitroreductase family protein n=1 Tax=Magnetovibrio sp. TaxID=2024836 RepID=UPI002F9226D9
MPNRTPAHPIDDIFVERWSPRAFDGQPMPHADLLSVLEAARWAPSAYNYQPWRFVYAHRDDPQWRAFVDLLVPFNAGWAQHASALVFVLSDTVMVDETSGGTSDGATPSRSHSFDAGAAWAQLALQATRLGYQARAMAGVDFDRAQERLGAPQRYRIEVAIALGRSTSPDHLDDALHKRDDEHQRRPVEELAFAGSFPA